MARLRKGVGLALAIVFAIVAVATPIAHKAIVQHRIELAVNDAGGDVTYDCDAGWTESKTKHWLAGLVGPQLVGNIVSISLDRCTDTAALAGLLANSGDLQSLRYLSLDDAAVDQTCVERIGQLRSLEKLWLRGANVADLAPLAHLPKLQMLSLDSARQITPAALATIANIRSLDSLGLADSDLQGSSLAGLGRFRPLVWLQLSATAIEGQDLDWLAAHPDLCLVVTGHVDAEEAKRIRAAVSTVVFGQPVPAAGS